MAYVEFRGDNARIRFQIGRRRHSVTFKPCDEARAKDAKEHIEHLIAQTARNRPPIAATLKWADALPDETHGKLSKIGLCEPRQVSDAPRTLIAFMRHYISGRIDWKKPENYRQAVDHLERYLKKRDVVFQSFTEGDAEEWHRWMIYDPKGPELSPNTAGQNVKRCRQMLRHAVKLGVAQGNPFDDVDINLESDESKNYHILRTDSLAILEACPDQEWRTIFVLVRWGGLRCPSEVLKLRWSDISWDRGRFKVTAPKLERYINKKERIVPLFNEVRQELESLQELQRARKADKAAQFVIQRYRDASTNLRERFLEICDRAAVARFQKPFMNCRQTRRNELEKEGWREAVLEAWFGHSGKTAAKYYSRPTEDEYEAAAKRGHVEACRERHSQESPRKTAVWCFTPSSDTRRVHPEGVPLYVRQQCFSVLGLESVGMV